MGRSNVLREDLELFIGPNNEYYLNQYYDLDKPKDEIKFKVNYCAFFFTFLWAVYRKMYLIAFYYFFIAMVLILGFDSYLGDIAGWIFPGIFAMFANKIYLYESRKRVIKLKLDKRIPNDQLQQAFVNKGGTNIISVIFGGVFWILISVLSLQTVSNSNFNMFNFSRESKIEYSTSQFIEGVFNSDFDTAVKYSYLDYGTDESRRDTLEYVSKLLKLTLGLQENFSGIPLKLTYEIEDISIVDDGYARVQCSLKSNYSNEKEYIEMTVKEFDDGWKVNVFTFLSEF